MALVTLGAVSSAAHASTAATVSNENWYCPTIRRPPAFYAPLLANRQNFEAWQEAGSIDAATRANAIWKQLLAEYEQPPLDPAIDDALVDYVERRKREIAND